MIPEDRILTLIALPKSERRQIARVLLDSVRAEEEPVSEEDINEALQTASDIDGGRSVCMPWDRFVAQLFPRK